ncbi:cytochrome b/b6 domain-containing protein [Labilibaculum sp. K2S]|uniref:cytochrome b/b6 domain-containing protein n=1 Tax=Labilibaculum sp. K2S TaxID=3056386 RepID=UPI0025A3308F|nr:cytochrome b/b6 domain-containing protein [Labilibaculum sp. K2S]MDM8160186.1 cytochrome b/b6 domain-containing protein [Labilibaculum sp. K2S]
MENKEYSKIYRIIHWAIAVSFLLLLATIFLRSTWLNKNNVADIIQNYLMSIDLSLSHDQLIRLAKQIRQPMWNWHLYIGYVLVGLFAVRFTIPFFGQMKIQNPLDKNLSVKEKIQKWTYIIFYVCVIISLVTGILIEWGPKSLKKSMEGIHVLSNYYLIPFIAIHLAGVLIEEVTSKKGTVSRIIGGLKA